MCKVMHVDGFVNLSHLEDNQFQSWLSETNTDSDYKEIIELVENQASSKDIQMKLLDMEEKLSSNQAAFSQAKDVRLEILTDKGYLTVGCFNSGGNSSTYVRNETSRQ